MKELNMDSEANILLERTEHEILIAERLKRLSEYPEAKKMLDVPAMTTFYSAVISHAYYAIFYSAKAYLVKKGVAISEQG